MHVWMTGRQHGDAVGASDDQRVSCVHGLYPVGGTVKYVQLLLQAYYQSCARLASPARAGGGAPPAESASCMATPTMA